MVDKYSDEYRPVISKSRRAQRNRRKKKKVQESSSCSSEESDSSLCDSFESPPQKQMEHFYSSSSKSEVERPPAKHRQNKGRRSKRNSKLKIDRDYRQKTNDSPLNSSSSKSRARARRRRKNLEPKTVDNLVDFADSEPQAENSTSISALINGMFLVLFKHG